MYLCVYIYFGFINVDLYLLEIGTLYLEMAEEGKWK